MTVEQIEHAARPPRARGRVSAPALLTLIVIAVLALGWSNRQGLADSLHERFGPQLDATMTIEPIAAGPLARRRDASAVWTGTEMIIWGGYASAGDFTYANHADGAAYDPVTKVWATIAPSPLLGREEHLAAWTGKEMIIWGGVRRVRAGMPSQVDGAAYDPATDRWRRIADAPMRSDAGLGAPTGVMWGGKLAVVVRGQSTSDGSGPTDAVLLYDPKTDRWETLRLAENPLSAAVYHGRLAVVGMSATEGPWLKLVGPDRELFAVPLPKLPVRPQAIGVVATRRALAVLDSDGNRTTIARWTQDPSQPAGGEVKPKVHTVPGERLTPAVDLFAGFPGATGALDDRHVLTFTDRTISLLDVTTGAVKPLSAAANYCAASAATAWTGRQMLAWGGQDCWDHQGPNTMAGGATYEPLTAPPRQGPP